MFIPHVGQEVIVTFEEGDPDRPIITGRVYNADMMPPLELPANKTKSVIRDHGGNEIIMEGEKGNERIRLHSPKHETTMTLGNSIKIETLSGWTSKIGTDKKEEVKGNAEEKVEGKKKEHIVGDAEVKVGADLFNFFIGAKAETTIGSAMKTTFGVKTEICKGAKIDISRGVAFEDNRAKKYESEKEGSSMSSDSMFSVIKNGTKQIAKYGYSKFKEKFTLDAANKALLQAAELEYKSSKLLNDIKGDYVTRASKMEAEVQKHTIKAKELYHKADIIRVLGKSDWNDGILKVKM